MTDTAPIAAPAARWIRRGWIVVLVGANLAVLVLVAVLVVMGDSMRTDSVEHLLATIAVVPPSAALALVGAVIHARGRLAGWMLLAEALLLIAAAGWAWLVWSAWEQPPEAALEIVRGLLSITIVGAWLVLAAALLAWRRPEAPLRIVRSLLAGAMTLLVAAVLLLLWSRWWQSRSIVLVGALAVGIAGTGLAGLGLAVVATWFRLRRGADAESVPRRAVIVVACPGCGDRAERAGGTSRCATCGTTLIIDVEEPRCECGYLLYRLSGDACPECGRAVTPSPASVVQ